MYSVGAFAQLGVTCSPLNLGTFLLDRGITSAEESGSSRLGFSTFIGNKAACTVSATSNTTVLVELNNDNSNSSLSNGNDSVPINVRLENNMENNLGTSTLLNIPANQNESNFYVDATVPPFNNQIGIDSLSTVLSIIVSYN